MVNKSKNCIKFYILFIIFLFLSAGVSSSVPAAPSSKSPQVLIFIGFIDNLSVEETWYHFDAVCMMGIPPGSHVAIYKPGFRGLLTTHIVLGYQFCIL